MDFITIAKQRMSVRDYKETKVEPEKLEQILEAAHVAPTSAKNITLGDMLDMWVEEELKPGSLSNGTVTAYEGTVSRIKKHPIGKRKLKTIKAEHLQDYMQCIAD